MFKKIFIVLGIAALFVGGWFGYLVVTDLYSYAEEKEQELSQVKSDAPYSRVVASGNITDEDMEELKAKGLNPFGEDKEQSDLTDYDYQEYIHGMSHQKVKADEKWGFYEITEKRIDWLLEGLDKVEVENKLTYKTILIKWADGDFSTVDEDHNRIWELQGGNVGKATGILSPEEEQKYIKSQK